MKPAKRERVRTPADPAVASPAAAAALLSLPILNEYEAAALLRVSRTLLQRWRLARNGGPRWVQFGTAIRYRRVDLDAWLEQCLVRPADQPAPDQGEQVA